MARRVKKGEIPVQYPNMDAAFAGKQWTMLAAIDNMEYQLFRNTILRLLYSNFKWDGLTEEESQTVEQLLIENGRVAAIRSRFDADLRSPEGVYIGKYGLPGDAAVFDFYNRPSDIQITGLNGITIHSNGPDTWAVGWDTNAVTYRQQMVMPLMAYIDYLAYTMVNAVQSWRVASETRKRGVIFEAKNSRVHSLLQQILEKISGNNPWVVVSGEIDDDIKTIMKTSGNGDGIDMFHQQYLNSWAMVMDLLGLENSNVNKKERLIQDELQYNLSLARYIGADRLRARESFAEALTRLYGHSITVRNYLKETLSPDINTEEFADAVL